MKAYIPSFFRLIADYNFRWQDDDDAAIFPNDAQL
jgi:hypothetical protein